MSATDTNNSTALMDPPLHDRPGAGIVQDDAHADSLMDPAHKALVDALRITYLLVKVAMWALVALFLLSGFQRVNTGENGIALAFGKIASTDLAPGLHPSWPYPIGELVKVSTAPVETTVEFLPDLSDAERRDLRERGPTALAGGGLAQLGVQDSYLLTADQAIGHAQWQLRWRRANAATTIQNINDEDLASIVQAVVRSAIVQAAATHTIDEILRSMPEDWRDPESYEPLPDQARRIAQQKLDDMNSGVEISQLSLSTRFAPRHVIEDFNSVSKAEQDAQRRIATAQMERESKLTSTAGAAAETILEQIDQYELDLAAQDHEAAQETYARIAALLSGKPVTIDGEEVQFSVSGQIARVVQEAEQFSDQIVADAMTSASIFQAKYAAFQANPAVVVHTDWANAMTSLLQRQSTQSMFMAPSGDMTFTLNRDPEVQRQLERERNAARKKEAMERRERERELERHQRERGVNIVEQ